MLLQEDLNNAIFCNKIAKKLPLIEHNTYELFITVRVLLSFFRALHKIPKHDDIFERLEVHSRLDFSTASNREAFEAMQTHNREVLLFVVSKLFKLKLDDIKQLFHKSKITYKILAKQLSIRSKTIDYLLQGLPISDTSYISVDTHKEIKPRSKEEVEKLMDEIRPFL